MLVVGKMLPARLLLLPPLARAALKAARSTDVSSSTACATETLGEVEVTIRPDDVTDAALINA